MVLSILKDVRGIKMPSGETMYVVKDVCHAVGVKVYLSILKRSPDIHRELVEIKEQCGARYKVNVTNLAGVLTIVLRHGQDLDKEAFDLFAKLLKKEGLV